MAVPVFNHADTTDPIYPTLSVIVPIYNGAADLPELIERLFNQTYPVDRVEYLLVDNGSCDRTPILLATAVPQAQQRGISLGVITYDQIQSSYAARNAGIRAAQGEILAFTDADCYPQSTWLEALVQPFTDSAVGLVAGEILAQPGSTWLERYADRQQTLAQTNTLSHRFCPYGQTANLALRRDCLRQTGLFRPHLTTGGDADLCWRIQQQTPWQLVLAQDAVIYHRHRQTLDQLRRQWYRYGCSNRYLHELHGVELMRPLTAQESRYRLLRWVGKEVPLALGNLIRGQGSCLDLVITPLDLWCARARSQGQRDSQLPAAARSIDPWPEPT